MINRAGWNTMAGAITLERAAPSTPKGRTSAVGALHVAEPVSPLRKPAPKKPSDLRVAVIGAGVSGLAAAQKLRAAGYTVTVFEKNAQVGGKVKTIATTDINGKPASIDIGAICGTRKVGPVGNEYDPIFAMADRFGITTRKFEAAVTYDPEKGTWESATRLKPSLKILWPIAKYLALNTFKWSQYNRGEVSELPAELKQSWDDLVKEYGLEVVTKVFQRLLTSSGYPPEMAAYHQTSALSPGLALSLLIRGGVYIFDGGYQGVWKKLHEELAADGVEFRFNADVNHIARSETTGKMTVAAPGLAEQRFDEVVVATDIAPLLTNKVLAPSAEQAAVLEKLGESVDYRSVVVKATGLPDHGKLTTGHIPGNTDKPGQPLLYCQQAPGVYTFYVYGMNPATKQPFSEQEINDNIATTITKMAKGAKLESVVQHTAWRYSPHANVADVQADVLERLHDLQGKNGLTFALAAASFECTARVWENATAVVERMKSVFDARHGVARDDLPSYRWWELQAPY